jgi:two-component system, LytTR family, sensor kinase
MAFWLPLSLILGWQMYALEAREHSSAVLYSLLLVYAARYFTVALLAPSIFYCVNRWPISGAIVRRGALYALGYVPFFIAYSVIRWALLPPWFPETLSWGTRTLSSLLDRGYNTFADFFVIYLGIVVAAHAYTYFVRGQRQELERLQLRQSLAQSELQALRAQLHPHFLFNTLQGVSTLIDSAPSTAQRMLMLLASLLRTVLKHGSADLVSLRKELEFAHAYLELERMRFGKRLVLRWDVGSNAYDALIPPLLLQPLIENAVMHGIANAREGGWIELSAKLQDSQLVVCIRNSVAGISAPGLRVGLGNVRARLKYLYAEDARLEFQLNPDTQQAVATVTLPAFTTPAEIQCLESAESTR